MQAPQEAEQAKQADLLRQSQQAQQAPEALVQALPEAKPEKESSSVFSALVSPYDFALRPACHV